MDNNLDKVAKDLYGKIQTRFPNIKIGDENAQVLSKKSDIPKARFFEFEYEEHEQPLGTIAISLDEDDGVVILVSGDLSEDTSSQYHDAYKFIRSFRKFAKNRLLNFDVQNIGKSNLDKRDYMFQAKPKEISKETPMMESKMFGTNRISYQDLGEARLVVKHNQPINPEISGARSMHIGHIYVENADGERFKYPLKHLNGARALAEHIKHGGNPYDSIGKHIIGLSEELAQLRKFKNYVGRQIQISEAMGNVTDKVLERIEEVKKQITQLQRSSYYESFVESFQEKVDQMIPEDIMNDWVDRLTVRTFNEEMKSVFPYLYNIVETNELPIRELNPDDLLDEAFGKKGLEKQLKKSGFGDTEYWEKGKKEKEERHSKANAEMDQRSADWKKRFGESISPETKIEAILENIVESKFQKDNLKLERLNDLLSTKLTGGESGAMALHGIIDNDEILDIVRNIEFDDKESEDKAIRNLIQDYMFEYHIDTISSLPNLFIDNPEDIGGEEVPPQEPAPAPAPAPEMAAPAPAPAPEMAAQMPPAPMPAAPMPMAESKTKMKAKFIKAKTAGASLDTKFSEGMSIRDAIKECGLDPKECGYADEETQHVNSHESGIDQLLKIIAGFWNREEKNFTIGGTRAKIKIVKAFEDGECPNANEHDVKQVLMLIDKKDPSQESSHINAALPTDSREHGFLNNLKVMKEQPYMESELSQIMKNAGLK